uniref:DCD domain-containing protein n=1 Tax=Kalanchoe fedtschenkoi TaxID=63787 RepID=A0A7N0T4F9_KALFE
MEAEKDDGKTNVVISSQENCDKPDEPVKNQLTKQKPDEPEGHSQEKHEEPGGQNTEKLGNPEEAVQNTEKLDEPEGKQQNKEKPDEPNGKQTKRKWRYRKKRNLSSGKVEHNKTSNLKSEVAQQEEVKSADPECSTQQNNTKRVKSMGTEQNNEKPCEPKGAEPRSITVENNSEAGKGAKTKKQNAKNGKVSVGTKVEKLKQKVGEASGDMKKEETNANLSSHDKGRKPDRIKDKLGGLIFMCSPKTKPDCFRFNVMGVSVSKKDLVLRIKPGLKLFLFDFDLKLLYGIYRATSSGGMKIEPQAFGGAFPAQVKFEVFKDCYPLPESIFKKAIKENYNEKRKFKTELTPAQVKKLATLFRPVQVGSNVHAHNPAAIRDGDTAVRRGPREYRTHSSRARPDRGGHNYEDYRREARREEYPRESFLSEREYHTDDLIGRRRSRSPPRRVGSSLLPRLDHESEVHLRYPVSVYRDTTTSAHHDPLLLSRRESPHYRLEGRRELPTPIRHEPTIFDGRRYLTHDPVSQLDLQSHLQPAVRQSFSQESNQQQYVYPSIDLSSDHPYRSAIRRDDVVASGPYYSVDGRRVVYLPDADPVRRRELEIAAFASSAPLDHNQGYGYQEASRHDPVFAPVSSRYSFAGPSFYR